ncbi:hypothetical protein G5714_020158 [Onychostoma macrolepis]|uniref:Uncharacterized protein n=1 Tax=Onychostoma macrolepis TaxID=369639 RepID=A0A7J6BT40_9TELE|nr:hypothetical protein G5714_020158 [Onychostoma macrolepis]
MSAAAEKDTVWIGFMDIVPVIGAVREAVELVLALYEGNKAVIKEKEKAVENIVKESLKKHVKLTTLRDKPPAAAVDEFSGLRNVRVPLCLFLGSAGVFLDSSRCSTSFTFRSPADGLRPARLPIVVPALPSQRTSCDQLLLVFSQ